METLKGLKPEKVMKYFEEISQIPHGSYNTKQISDYCVNFAKERNLKYIQDEYNNVIIFKNATNGYENSQPVIIQGHLDMVLEKEKWVTHDTLKLNIDGDYIYADGTTLGGDDGIAVAYALAILDSDNLKHPALEIVFTVDEEVGMIGASHIDVSMLKGRKFLNIDSEEEGVFLTSCAGGATVECKIECNLEDKEGYVYEIDISGLPGGHSGIDIDKGRINSNILLGKLLNKLRKDISFCIVDIGGGEKDNVIPKKSTAHILTDCDNLEEIKGCITEDNAEYTLNVTKQGIQNVKVLDNSSTLKILSFLTSVPNGVQKMSSEVENLVQTSLNLGILKNADECVSASFSVRSSKKEEKEQLIEKLNGHSDSIQVSGEYPAWEYKKDSEVREKMTDIYKKLFGTAPKIDAVHAGLECGMFSEKLQDIDCISFGPNLYDIHTTKERMSVSSVERVWNLLIKFLEESK